jgi:uncharacterized protein (TIGR02118 family)
MSKFAVIFGERDRGGRSEGRGPAARIPGLIRATRNDVVDIVHREHVARTERGVSRVDELWCDGAPEDTLEALQEAYAGMPVIQISPVQENMIFERDAVSSMLVKRISLLQRKAGLSRTEFSLYWRDVHASMASCHRHVARYVQNHVLDGSGALFDGIAEFQITDVDGMREDYETEPARAMKDDVRNFAATVSTFVVRAHHVRCA